MKTLRFRRPLQVIYLVPEVAPDGGTGIPTVNLDLKMETLTTMAEAADLERKLIQIEEQYRSYHVCTTLSGQGSLALQLIGHLFRLTGHAKEYETKPEVKAPERAEPTFDIPEEVTAEWLANLIGLQDPDWLQVKAPERDEPPFDVPEEVTAEWLAKVLGHALSLPVELIGLQDPDWIQVPLAYLPSMAKDMMAFHGAGAKKDLIVALMKLAEQKRNDYGGCVIAVGVHETTEPKRVGGNERVKLMRVYFKVRIATPNGRPAD